MDALENLLSEEKVENEVSHIDEEMPKINLVENKEDLVNDDDDIPSINTKEDEIPVANESEEEFNNSNEDLDDYNISELNTDISKSTTVVQNEKKLKIFVANSRAGIGKTTIATQLIAPYIYIKESNKKVPIYTLEVMMDNHTFTSNIINANIVEVNENSFVRNAINLFTKDEAAIYDIGGGNATEIILTSLINTGLIFTIDLFVIPLTDGIYEANKAYALYRRIKNNHKEAKFCFILNKANQEDKHLQFPDFLGENYPEDISNSVMSKIDIEDRNITYMYQDEIIKYSVRNKLTVFEYAFVDTSSIDSLLKKAILENDLNNQQKYAVAKNNISKAIAYYENCLKPSMDKFDTLLNGNYNG